MTANNQVDKTVQEGKIVQEGKAAQADKTVQEGKVDLSIAPAVIPAVVDAAVGVASLLMKGLSVEGKYDIASAVVNLTNSKMDLLPGISNHHGQYVVAPVSLLPCPASVEDISETKHGNMSVVEMTSTGKACSETLWGYEMVIDDVPVKLCLYMKHGRKIEAGAAIWNPKKHSSEKDSGEVYMNFNSKLHDKSAEPLFHIMQRGEGGDQTAYSRDGEACTLHSKKYIPQLKVRFVSGRNFKFIIETA